MTDILASIESGSGPAPAALDFAPLRAQCFAAAGLLKLLANPDRLLILCFLSEGVACVSRIEAATGIMQPTLSQQLTVLREKGLIEARREGKFIYYRVKDPSVHVLLQTLHGLFCRVPGPSTAG
ncbi:MAG: ArsR/SmtB family transcription factor [Casimicrobiaceae bacterium]